MLTASSAVALGGMGALWFLRRRARLMGQAELMPVSARSLLRRAAQVALILLGAAVIGGPISMLFIQFESLVFSHRGGITRKTRPDPLGLPLWNWLKGALIGGIAAAILVIVVRAFSSKR